MDHARASVEGILSGPDFVRVPSVEVFVEHELRDKKGNIVRKVDEKKLRAIAKTALERYRKTGDLSPFGPGHTYDDEYEIVNGKPRLVRKFPETQQPPIWGFLGPDAEVKKRADGKMALYQSAYVRREIEFQDGDRARKIPGKQVLAEFPRRSPEYYPGEDRISYLALLRREPKLDMGLTVYAKNFPDCTFYLGNRFAAVAPMFGPTRYAMGVDEMVPSNQPLRYEPEPPAHEPPTEQPTTAGPTNAGGEAGGTAGFPPEGWTPEHAETAEHYAHHVFGMPHAHAKTLMHHMKAKYGHECGLTPAAAHGAAMHGTHPGVSQAATPPHGHGGETTHPEATHHPANPEHLRMQKDQETIAKARYDKRTADLEARLAEMERRAIEATNRETAARYERDLKTLQFQNYDIDLVEEMKFCCPENQAPISQAAFETHVNQIKRYQRDRQIITDPNPIDRFDRTSAAFTVLRKKNDPSTMSEDEALEVSRYMYDTGATYEEALKHHYENGVAQ